MLILNDKFHRNCTKKLKKTADCFIHNEEYMEELEFPMWGYVTPEELNGFIVESVTITKINDNKIRIQNSNLQEFYLTLSGHKNCDVINKFHISSQEQIIFKKIERLKNSLLKFYSCNNKQLPSW